jgi:Fe-S cluster biosynthesis and repair protein YggX
MAQADPDRTVHCKKLDQELPGLARQPFPTEFGKWIFDNVSHQAWEDWLKESVRYINTYRVDLSSKQGAEFMVKQMKVHFGLEEGDKAETAWVPEKE